MMWQDDPPRPLARRTLLAGSAAAVLTPEAAPGTAILDVSAVPRLDDAGRAAYRVFLLADLPRAFAVGEHGQVGAAAGAPNAADAQRQALQACRRNGAAAPRLYAQDLAVVWTAPAPPPAPQQAPLIETWNYSFTPDARFFWQGPARARGVYVWAHGTSTDPFGLQPPPHVRAFNNAGFDIVRFDRVPNADDVDRAALWLRGGLRTVRQLGWRQVVSGGHSRGAWNCLQMLKTANLADLVIADSPAAHGMAGGFFLSAQTDDLRQIVDDVPPSRTRLVFIQFQDDPYIGDPDVRRHLIDRLQARLGGLVVIDRPAGFSGHFAARGMAFAVRFSNELLKAAA
jgi:hypothetical protein